MLGGFAAASQAQHQQEFLAAPAHRVVAAAQALAQGLRGVDQHAVADAVAVLVIDPFEVIKVDQHQQQALALVGR